MIDYSRLIRILNEAKIEFMIVGGVAGVIHGASRLTQDLDIVYERSQENISRLVDAFSKYHPYPRGAPMCRPKDLEAIAELESILEEIET